MQKTKKHFDKDQARKKVLEKNESLDRTQNKPFKGGNVKQLNITKETINNIIKLYPTHTSVQISEKLKFSLFYTNRIIQRLKRNKLIVPRPTLIDKIDSAFEDFLNDL